MKKRRRTRRTAARASKVSAPKANGRVRKTNASGEPICKRGHVVVGANARPHKASGTVECNQCRIERAQVATEKRRAAKAALRGSITRTKREQEEAAMAAILPQTGPRPRAKPKPKPRPRKPPILPTSPQYKKLMAEAKAEYDRAVAFGELRAFLVGNGKAYAA